MCFFAPWSRNLARGGVGTNTVPVPFPDRLLSQRPFLRFVQYSNWFQSPFLTPPHPILSDPDQRNLTTSHTHTHTLLTQSKGRMVGNMRRAWDGLCFSLSSTHTHSAVIFSKPPRSYRALGSFDAAPCFCCRSSGWCDQVQHFWFGVCFGLNFADLQGSDA